MRLRQFSILFLVLFLAGCGGDVIEENMSGHLPDFEFTTQDNEPLGLNDLEGNWWIADFMYTNCRSVCPMMTANMLQVQSQLNEENIDITIVSFSVDPDYDTPEILKEYANEYQVDTTNWSFLTGYDFDTVQELSVHSFKTSLEQAGPDTGDDQIAHGTNFFLVNPAGEVVKKYDGLGQGANDDVVEDLKNIL